DKEVRQFAQMLIYEFSQLAATRGGQALYTDIHIYCEIPPHWAKLPAIGPGGIQTGRTYIEYAEDARRFAMAICEVFKKGDATGKPFILPRPLLHLTEAYLMTKDSFGLLREACAVASQKGNMCFIFDRGSQASTFVCLKTAGNGKQEYADELDKPWLIRTAAIQSVTLNLPRIAYKAENNDKKLWQLLQEVVSIAVKTQIQKKDFLEKLLSYDDQGPLAALAMNHDGFPYLRMNRAFYIIGLVGLNELVQIHLGSQLHETKEALGFGLKVIEFLDNEIRQQGREHSMKFVLEQTPAETTAYRFARLDLRYHSPAAGRIVKGDIAEGAIYYTNSTHLNVAAEITPMQRVIQEGLFHQYLEGEVITHLQLGGFNPEKEELCRFLINVFNKSANRQVDFTPEFTSCKACGKIATGLNEKCIYCGSTDIEGIARLTKYYSKISSWNKGKLAELKNRKVNKDFNQ
ncbi:MAG: anaerobic ribonucleoside-triphosphate reductase, partial [Smithella sp.]